MKTILISVLFLLTSCIQVTEVTPGPYVGLGIDDEFHPYVLAFEQEWGHQVTNQSIFFVDMMPEEEIVGLCWCTERHRIITIDKNWWFSEGQDKRLREMLIFHELGHAQLGRDHLDAKTANGHNVSIMHSQLGDPDYYEANRQKFIEELFTQHPKTKELWFCDDLAKP